MERKYAASLFLGVCMILALLLLTGTITPLVSGSIFAVALAVLGGLSRGFRRQGGSRP